MSGALLVGVLAMAVRESGPVDAVGVAPMASSVSGMVFQDFNSNGELDAAVAFGQATDVGIAGVTVSAYNAAGDPVGTTTSAADGTYTLAVTSTVGEPLRIEFEVPTTGPLAALRPSFVGSGNGTTIQFVEAGDTGVDAAFNVPGEYCQANPHLVISRICAGTGAGLDQAPTVFVTRYDGGPYDTTTALTDGFTSWSSNTAGTKTNTGSILGMTWDPTTQRVYNTAYVRRHADLYEIGGVPAPGALFVTTPGGTSGSQPTGGTTTFLVDLETLLDGRQFSNDQTAGPGFIPTNADRQIHCMVHATTANGCGVDDGVDSDMVPGRVGVFEEVGMTGIGDIETDGQGRLWVVSLYDRHLYEVTLPADGTAPTTMTSWGDISQGVNCVSGEARPFSVRLWRGMLYLGVVCDASSEFDEDTPLGVYNTNLTFSVLSRSLDPQGAFTTFFGPHPLNSGGNIHKGVTDPSVSYPTSRTWNAWTNYFPPKADTAAARQFHNRPQPLLSEIEFDSDGSMILGFRDRAGDQSSTNLSETPTGGSTQFPTIASGDIYRVCRTGPGFTGADYVFEGAAGCTQKTTPAGNGTEYYFGDAYLYPSGPNWEVGHGEISAGMLLQVPGFADVIFSGFDPFSGPSNGRTVFYSGGIRYLRNDSGKPYGAGADLGDFPNAGGGVMVYSDVGEPLSAGGFQKVNGMSDIEALCDAAPVQIGNRVWIDTNKNGIQDAGEEPVAGVTVRLYSADGQTLLGTAITNADGEYYFSSNVTEAPEGNGDNIGGGVVIGQSHIVRLDNPTDYQVGGPLFGYVLTGDHEGVNTSIDSNATTVNGFPQISVPARLAGENDHTFDVGFYLAPPPPSAPVVPTLGAAGSVSVGDYVWWDTNGDGRQDATDVPLAGVVLTITTVDGGPVTDINGNPVTSTTTNAQGWYTFDNLPYGEYRVTVTPPAGFTPTLANVGSTDKDSSTGFAVSRNLTTRGDRDPTLDFGFVANGVSVGNFVWFDANNDGIQDSGEQPIAGAVLTITDMTGNSVTDLAGRLVGPQTTGSDGTYLFTNLPPGQYRVSIIYPPGFGPTRPTEGGDRANDSSTFVAVTQVLAAGQADLTLDFGMIPVVSVGDYVWWDTNGDGRQDSTDVPLEGVMLRITTVDGRPVFDSQGLLVTTTLTDANGWYTFDNLPLGQYMVCVTDPDGFVATLANVGSIDGDSSTGCATSRDLPVGGDRDPTLDFGYVALDMRLPATGVGSAQAASVAVLLLGMGWAVLLSADRRRRRLL